MAGVTFHPGLALLRYSPPEPRAARRKRALIRSVSRLAVCLAMGPRLRGGERMGVGR